MAQVKLDWDKANEKAIEKALKELYAANEEKGVFALGAVAEQVINKARKEKTYQDQTGNLRNSTGYILVENSKDVKEDFGSGEGAKIGKKIALENKSNNKNEVQLIIDSGMEYSIEVESKGYKVLSFALPSIIGLSKEIQKFYNK
jgi:hypothetical protein